MRYPVLMAVVVLAGCAGQAPLDPVAAAGVGRPLLADATAVAPAALPLADPQAGRICKTMKRPGSNIADTVCYTREEQLAKQQESKETIDELEREAHFRDQAIQDAMMRNRYPTGPGLGPR